MITWLLVRLPVLFLYIGHLEIVRELREREAV